jgi:dipeptidyl aminopeptidase/acylaminoacyl peptidase
MKKLFIALMTFTVSVVTAQKKVIDHTVYNDWKKIEHQVISKDGQFVAYEITPHRGDGFLYLYDVKEAKLDSFYRGTKPVFSPENSYISFTITPGFDTLRSCELKKVDKKEWPKDTLAIYVFSTDSLLLIANLKSYTVAEESAWLAYTLETNEPLIKATPEKARKKKRKKNKKNGKTEKPVEPTSDGKRLTVFNPIIDKSYQYKDVTEFVFSKKGASVAFVSHKKIKQDHFKYSVLTVSTGASYEDTTRYTAIKEMTFDPKESQLVFLTSTDTVKNKSYALMQYQLNDHSLKSLIDLANLGLDEESTVSENRHLQFTDDSNWLYFGVGYKGDAEEKDTLLETEKAKLDVWHYQDKRLQPQQLLELKKDSKKSDLYVYDFVNTQAVKLSNDTLQVRENSKLAGPHLFASSTEQYAGTYNWQVPNLEDHYRVTIADGSVELIKKAVGFVGKLSPSGDHYVYYDGKKRAYFWVDLKTKKETCITCSRTDVVWHGDNNGMPFDPYPRGVQGWYKGEDSLMLQSEYDIWNFSISSKKLRSASEEMGKKSNTRITASEWDRDSIYVDYANLNVLGFDEQAKGRTAYNFIQENTHWKLNKVYSTAHELVSIEKATNTDAVILRKMSVSEYPEVYLTDLSFGRETKLSTTNPQQSEYNWATVELIDWKSYDGIDLQGLVYKPENFDSTKSYPMLVYFYELYNEEFHNHYIPKPTASIIYASEYASAGYVVFIPDIRYKEGFPAKSAYDCIMSGTDEVLKRYPNIDSTRMGLQGQSWGGYQTAQLITMTTRYKAAMAGAPVSNMFSAYGGIRWGSGMNRQFQYEKTQSRIGKTIWEAPELYYENSPLFHLPKVTTPLLIMHNDGDGAVPWYQGIELFTGMKRLGLPVWMLNYNGDGHNLMKNANRIDLSIRMRQFFDYYLLGTAPPSWLIEGIPATVKGKETRYDLMKD